MNKKIVLAAAVFALLAGCNTIKGMGQDIRAAGNGIENAASKKGGSTSKPASSPSNP